MARDHLLPTFSASGTTGAASSGRVSFPAAEASAFRGVAAEYLAHRFDLLGSGWTRVVHGKKCRGLHGIRFPPGPPVRTDAGGAWLRGRINRSNLAEARRIWALADPDYTPIDWQLDFKSGFRWSERTWYRAIRRRRIPRGADLKVPWELGRLQHLPQLALAWAGREGSGAGVERTACLREIRNQTLDFIATNPPRFGVQWVSPMDVAIRAANLAVTRSVLKASGVTEDPGFDRLVDRSLHEHGEHVMAHLEWSPSRRGNHYLANVTGMLFIAAHLPRSRRTDAWLAFAAQELIAELHRQFLPDGGNFEASTGYHVLSSEMIACGLGLLVRLPPDRRAALEEYDPGVVTGRPPLRAAPLDLEAMLAEARERVARMTAFIADARKPSGAIHQVGDNDSGKFLGLSRRYHAGTVRQAVSELANLDGYDELPADAEYWLEDTLDPGPVVAALEAVFPRGGEGAHASAPAAPEREGVARGPTVLAELIRDLPAGGLEYTIDVPELVRGEHDLRPCAYPDFGLYIFRGPDLYVGIRCGGFPVPGSGGHAHNDQLAVEVYAGGEDWVADPGTYLYTPFPDHRNRYRSVAAHFAPRVVSREPASLDEGLFRLDGEAGGQCLHFDGSGFLGVHAGYGRPVYRSVQVKPGRVVVRDYAEAGLSLAPIEPADLPAFSPGYGLLTRGARVRFSSVTTRS